MAASRARRLAPTVKVEGSGPAGDITGPETVAGPEWRLPPADRDQRKRKSPARRDTTAVCALVRPVVVHDAGRRAREVGRPWGTKTNKAVARRRGTHSTGAPRWPRAGLAATAAPRCPRLWPKRRPRHRLATQLGCVKAAAEVTTVPQLIGWPQRSGRGGPAWRSALRCAGGGGWMGAASTTDVPRGPPSPLHRLT